MKKILLTAFLTLIWAGSAQAELEDLPDSTIMVSLISDLVIVDDYAVAVSQEGIATFRFDETASRFVFCKILFLDIDANHMKRFGNLLAIVDTTDIIHFLDLSGLPDLQYFGSVNPEVSIVDFEVSGNSLYVATGFDGIWHFRMTDYSSAQFVDSSMLGVCVTQLAVMGDELYALDEYNGLMRYDISAGSLDQFVEYLWLPRSGQSLITHDGLFYAFHKSVLQNSPGIYVCDFGEAGPAIIDSAFGFAPPAEAYLADPVMVLLYQDGEMLLVDRGSLSNLGTYDVGVNRITGDVFQWTEHGWLILPEPDGGFTMYDLLDGATATPGLDFEGKIVKFFIHNDKLFTAAETNPTHVLTIDGTGDLTYDFTVLDDLNSLMMIGHNGDTLFSKGHRAGCYDSLHFINDMCEAGTVYLDTALYGPDTVRGGFIYVDEPINGYQSILLSPHAIAFDVYCFDDADEIVRLQAGQVVDHGKFRSSAIIDTVLYSSWVDKDSLGVSRFKSGFFIITIDMIAMSSEPLKLLMDGDRLYVFQADSLQVFDVSTRESPVHLIGVEAPVAVIDAVLEGSLLYGAGPDGVVVFDVSQPTPVLVDQGGRGGEMIAVGSNILAVSAGDGIHIFNLNELDAAAALANQPVIPDRFSLAQNYPNPFNPVTAISYGLPNQARVELAVYNILGRKVTTLVNETQAPGNYTVYWNGTTGFGNPAATGLYFYRLKAGDYVESRKMLLLK